MGNRLTYIGYSVPDYTLEMNRVRNMLLNDKILNLEKFIKIQNDNYSNRISIVKKENQEILDKYENLIIKFQNINS